MKHPSRLAALLLVTALSAAPLTTAVAAEPPAKFVNGVLVDARGMTVYTFDKDTTNSGKSACNGPCAVMWPPVAADASARPAGPFAIVTRRWVAPMVLLRQADLHLPGRSWTR